MTATSETQRALRRERGLPHWRPSQRRRLRELMAEGATIGYWNGDAHGRPANGGQHDGWRARAGLVQEIAGPLVLCGPGALHATASPHRWKGCRVWMVALLGEVAREADKAGSLRREFIGEILPEEAIFDPGLALVLRANLSGADLSRANLSGADLSRANLSGADLSRANLSRANLSGADLSGADLSRADLSRANLSRANLSGADLSGADLSGADLSGADLSRAYRSTASPAVPGWRTLATGYLEREEQPKTEATAS